MKIYLIQVHEPPVDIGVALPECRRDDPIHQFCCDPIRGQFASLPVIDLQQQHPKHKLGPAEDGEAKPESPRALSPKPSRERSEDQSRSGYVKGQGVSKT